MHDGQNLFYNKESFSGHSWKVIQTLKSMHSLPQMIIVGIDNDGISRMNEYTPWEIYNQDLGHSLQIGGQGDQYGEFVMNTIKPFIDSNYRTRPEKEYTGMCGSSLGANITSYMGIKYKDQIGCLGIFSLANWLTDYDFDNYIKDKSLDSSQKVYIQVGTEEGDSTDEKLTNKNLKQIYIDGSLKYYRQLIKSGVLLDNIQLEIVSNAKHEEKVWARYLPNCLNFFSVDW